MTITECIENMDRIIEDIESLDQIPSDEKNSIINKIDEVCDMMDKCIVSYGDDSNGSDDGYEE